MRSYQKRKNVQKDSLEKVMINSISFEKDSILVDFTPKI